MIYLKILRFFAAFLTTICALACSNGGESRPIGAIKNTFSGENLFNADMARDNLSFARTQYLKMLTLIRSEQRIHMAAPCASEMEILCYPRMAENGNLFLEAPEVWTNGFFPGILWMLLQSETTMPGLSAHDKTALIRAARHYTGNLASEARRGSTHDLGFIVYNSFGQGLATTGLSTDEQAAFQKVIQTARDTLAQRYSADFGVIKSWDWPPRFSLRYLAANGRQKTWALSLSDPWQYPVIVDNMMNLELMLTSADPDHRALAFDHATQTAQNHYFYSSDDADKRRPLAYHVFDYGQSEPGNWQGLGNISAWARGQAWSFYGFVTVMEFAAKATEPAATQFDYDHFVERLYDTLQHYMGNAPVPLWDFFATRYDAAQIAAATPEGTSKFSKILGLCDFLIDDTVLPYRNWAPIFFDASILSQDSLHFLKRAQPVRGDTFVIQKQIGLCGSKPYELSDRRIPKDTSASAIIAAGLYRLAQQTENNGLKTRYIAFADKIMTALSTLYRTDKGQKHNFELGFVLHSATGNLPSGREINTSINYADYYFIEANLRKLALSL